MKTSTLAARLCRSAAIGALLAATASHAFAQQAPSTQTVETVQPAEPPADETTGDRVVITGSRLGNQFQSAAPMDVVVAEEAAAAGISDVASLLRSTTVASGSPQITAVTSTAFVQDGGVGAETISLRGLGANRTLVLLDGRRAGPAGTRGSVGAFDFNVLPLSAIERVEILKEGASSIYGSDAIAGVINVITKKGDGADFDMFYSAPLNGGGDEFRINGSWGETFNNLHVRVTADYHKQTELARGDRDFFACGQPYVFRADGSRGDLVDPRTGDYTCSSDLIWGHIWFYDYTQPGAISRPWQARPQLIQFNYDNNLQQYLPGLGPNSSGWTIPAGWFPVGYGELNRPGATPDAFYGPSARLSEAVLNYHHPFQDQESLSPEIERMTVMAKGEFDVNDSMQLYAEALLNRRMTKVNGYRQYWTYQYVYDYGGGSFAGDPIAYAEGWRGPAIGLSPTAITDHNDTTVTVDYMRFVGGARGDLPWNTWSWDVAAQFSRSDGDYKSDIIWDDAITPYEFQSSLCAGTVTSYRGVPCVDVNWYTPQIMAGNPTPQERAFLFGSATGNTIYEQTSVEAYVTGELFNLPAGPLGVVVGALYQEDMIDDQPAQAIQDGEAWGDSEAGRTQGEDTTSAIYGELGIPILKGVPAFHELTLTLSGRYTDVDSYGSESTYKAGINWGITPTIRLRASQGTSFRSPALFELFLASETSFLGQRLVDPCINWAANLANQSISQRVATNCAADGIPNNHNGSGASATIFSSGGFGTLAAETSTSKSFGVIWTPDFADLSVSLDYFDIEVENEVTKLGAGNIMLGCYDSLNFATEPLCNLFTRNPAGNAATQFLVVDVIDNFLNISTQTNRGIDLDAVYSMEIPWGELALRGQVSYQLEDEIQLLPTSTPDDFNGRIGDPEWVGNFAAELTTGPFEFFYGLRYVGETSNVERFGSQAQTYQFQPVRYVLDTDEIIYHDVSVNVEPVEGFNVRFGIRNLLDEKPPLVTALSGEFNTVGNIPLEAQYDFYGRTVFVNLTKTF